MIDLLPDLRDIELCKPPFLSTPTGLWVILIEDISRYSLRYLVIHES